MKTVTVRVDKNNPSPAVMEQAAQILRHGGLVAFPTETVYGLGADALNPEAVRKIYGAKSRPADNPLIAHICDIRQLGSIACDVSPKAHALMDAFWPGPLTLILKKTPAVPSETAGGLDTVAVRFPSGEIARLLIQAAQTPIAAPSANTAGKPSPTCAEHVGLDLDGKIDMIIDGGSCELGLESTIIDMSAQTPCLLRPGAVTKEQIEDVVGRIDVDSSVLALDSGGRPKAPGMKYRHYAPLAKMSIIEGRTDDVVNEINRLAALSPAECIGILATEQTKSRYPAGLVLSAGDRNKPETIAANLFKLLRKFDDSGVTEIYAEGFSESGIGLAIMNRLRKAAGNNIVSLGTDID